MAKKVRPNFTIPEPGWDQLIYWRRKSVAKSFVYVIQAEWDLPIKVGVANDVSARIASLQTGNPRRLDLLHVLIGDRALERELHSLFEPDERLVGEWFDGPGVSGFLEMAESLAYEMLLRHKNGKTLPDYRQFPPFRERHEENGRPIYVTHAFHARSASA